MFDNYLTVDTIGDITNLIKSSIKFRLPDYGILTGVNCNNTKELLKTTYPDGINLPYPVTALEIPFPTEDHPSNSHDVATAYILLLDQTSSDGKIKITTITRLRTVIGDYWLPQYIRLHLDRFTFDVYGEPYSKAGDEAIDKYGVNGAFQEFISVWKMVVEFLSVLSCSNVRIEDTQVYSKLNKKRESKNKQPFFTYKILTIPGSKNSDVNLGGSHASPRVHLRRGHIRRLKNKNIWINSMVVGNKSKGMVFKDYELRRAA